MAYGSYFTRYDIDLDRNVIHVEGYVLDEQLCRGRANRKTRVGEFGGIFCATCEELRDQPEQPPTEERPYTPGQSGLFKKRDGTEFERRKR